MVQDVLIRAYLKRLRLPTMASNYMKFAEEASAEGQSYEGYLLALLEAEVIRRDENREMLRMRQARFPSIKTLDSFEFGVIPGLNRSLVLELARGGYIEGVRMWY